MTKSSLPVGGYSVNPYVGCPHVCRYCYASFMKRFTGHTEKWGTFLDVKNWPRISDPHKYDGQRIVIGITDVPAIIERAKDQADLIWLENLNLRGKFKGEIMRYIAEKYPQLVPLYDEIYNKGDRSYWQILESQVKRICMDNDFPYLRNDLPYGHSEPGKPVIVNYFYHEEIRLNNK
jgi:hypothetical protein